MAVDGNVDFPQIVFEKGATERGFQSKTSLVIIPSFSAIFEFL